MTAESWKYVYIDDKIVRLAFQDVGEGNKGDKK